MGALTFILPSVIACLTVIALTPLVRRVALLFGAAAQPTEDRWHKTPTALFGGVAIYCGFAVGVVVAALALPGHTLVEALSSVGRVGYGIIAAATFMFLLGLADDLFNFRPATKLIGE